MAARRALRAQDFPDPQARQRRIVLAYTEAVRPVGGIRHFSYPLPIDPGGTTKIRHFDLDVEVRGQDPKFAVRTLGYPVSASDRDGARAFSFSADDFTPNGDLSIEWALPRTAQRIVLVRLSSGRRTLCAAHAPAQAAARDHRSDTRHGDRGRHQPLDVRRRFGACQALGRTLGSRTRIPPVRSRCWAATPLVGICLRAFLTPGPQAAQTIEHFLSAIVAEGASDPTQAIATAKRALEAVPGTHVQDIVFIGDGTPTVGPIRSATVTSAVRDILAGSRARITTVAVGSASDLDTLGALARAGGGLVLPYVPGQTLNQATLGVLSASYGSALRDVEVVLPDVCAQSHPRSSTRSWPVAKPASARAWTLTTSTAR